MHVKKFLKTYFFISNYKYTFLLSFPGAIYDATNSYHMAFIVGGLLIVIGGLLHFMLFIPKIAKRRKEFQKQFMVDQQDCIIEETVDDLSYDEEQQV